MTLSDIDSQIIYSDDLDTLQVGNGETFVFVNGLGGKSIRDAEDNLEKNPWWAKYSTSDNGANYGALFWYVSSTSDVFYHLRKHIQSSYPPCLKTCKKYR